MEEQIQMPLNDVLLVGYDFTHGDKYNCIIVGKNNGKTIDIINAFQGDDAVALYEMLTTPAKKKVKKGDTNV